jgi:3-dehydroquinate synthase
VISLNVDLGERSYPVRIGSWRDWELQKILDPEMAESRAVIADTKVWNHWGRDLEAAFGSVGVKISPLLMESGETGKTHEAVFRIYDHLLAKKVRRDGCLFVFGGGVLGDIAGFAAATYQRGIRYVQIPTTLLSMVDSSVGGKTGVNFAKQKNMIGAFHQPAAVLIAPEWLMSLSEREVRAGLAEVIKCGVIRDPKLLDLLESIEPERLLRSGRLEEVIARALAVKADIVAEDEHDLGIRQHLNFGHTLGHAIETATGFGQYLHGEAVAIGMVAALRLSTRVVDLAESSARRVEELLRRYSLPCRTEGIKSSELLAGMEMDKKATARGQAWVLTPEVGTANVTTRVSAEELRDAVSYITGV